MSFAQTPRPWPRALKIILRVLCIFLAVAFLTVWAYWHVIMVIGGLMGTAMMNDSGRMSYSLQTGIMCGVLFSQFLTALAGIPASLAFFWWSRSLRCLKISGVLFAVGVALLIGLGLLVFIYFGK